jgi:hypothetical protein
MNLRVMPGLAHPCLTIDAISISIRPSTRRFPGCVPPHSFQSCIFLPGWNCVPSPLQGYQLLRRVGRFKLWKQVQKSDEFVDITSYGALFECRLKVPIFGLKEEITHCPKGAQMGALFVWLETQSAFFSLSLRRSGG